MKQNVCAIFTIAALSAGILFGADKEPASKDAPKDAKKEAEKPAEAVPTPPKTVLPFRSGEIFSAEISRIKPVIEDENQFDTPKANGLENPVWAEIIFKPGAERKISRFDYVLVSDRGTYPCIAVALQDKPYSMKKEAWFVEKITRGAFYRILFALNEKEITAEPLVGLTLKYKLRDTKLPPPTLSFRVMPENKPLSKTDTLKKGGTYGLTYEIMLNPPKPVPAPEAKKEEPKKTEAKKEEVKPVPPKK